MKNLPTDTTDRAIDESAPDQREPHPTSIAGTKLICDPIGAGFRTALEGDGFKGAPVFPTTTAAEPFLDTVRPKGDEPMPNPPLSRPCVLNYEGVCTQAELDTAIADRDIWQERCEALSEDLHTAMLRIRELEGDAENEAADRYTLIERLHPDDDREWQ